MASDETPESIAAYAMQAVLDAVFDTVEPIEASMFELLDIIVEEVVEIVTGAPTEIRSMWNPEDIQANIQETIDIASEIRKEVWSRKDVLDLMACCIALLETPLHLPVTRWIERGLVGSEFAGFDLQARVLDYACLFDNVSDTPATA